MTPNLALLSWLGKAPSPAWESSGTAADLEQSHHLTHEGMQEKALGHLLEVKGKGKKGNFQLSWLGKAPPPVVAEGCPGLT